MQYGALTFASLFGNLKLKLLKFKTQSIWAWIDKKKFDKNFQQSLCYKGQFLDFILFHLFIIVFQLEQKMDIVKWPKTVGRPCPRVAFKEGEEFLHSFIQSSPNVTGITGGLDIEGIEWRNICHFTVN